MGGQGSPRSFPSRQGSAPEGALWSWVWAWHTSAGSGCSMSFRAERSGAKNLPKAERCRQRARCRAWRWASQIPRSARNDKLLHAPGRRETGTHAASADVTGGPIGGGWRPTGGMHSAGEERDEEDDPTGLQGLPRGAHARDEAVEHAHSRPAEMRFVCPWVAMGRAGKHAETPIRLLADGVPCEVGQVMVGALGVGSDRISVAQSSSVVIVSRPRYWHGTRSRRRALRGRSR